MTIPEYKIEALAKDLHELKIRHDLISNAEENWREAEAMLIWDRYQKGKPKR